MSIIRFSDEEVFSTDGKYYEILTEAVKLVGDTPGIALEIGTRRGGSAKMIMDTLVEIGSNKRPFICVDPYGNIEVPITIRNAHRGELLGDALKQKFPDQITDENLDSVNLEIGMRFDYNDEMRNRVIPSLYYYAYEHGFDFRFFQLEDSEFMKRYADGIPFYNEVKTIVNSYAFVYFDGPHTNETVYNETKFLAPRSAPGSVYVFDDIWSYGHDELIEPVLFENGFENVEKNLIKASYQRRK